MKRISLLNKHNNEVNEKITLLNVQYEYENQKDFQNL